MSDSTLTLTGRLSPRDNWSATLCPIGRTLEIIGNRSAFLLLREAFYGTTRFDQFALRVGISEPVASARLKELVEAGLLERRPYQEPGQRTRLEYHLSEMGVAFFPVLTSLMQWGDEWLGKGSVEMRHHDCGELVRTELRCASGHGVSVDNIDLVPRS